MQRWAQLPRCFRLALLDVVGYARLRHELLPSELLREEANHLAIEARVKCGAIEARRIEAGIVLPRSGSLRHDREQRRRTGADEGEMRRTLDLVILGRLRKKLADDRRLGRGVDDAIPGSRPELDRNANLRQPVRSEDVADRGGHDDCRPDARIMRPVVLRALL